jgi:formylglycine-generating enzyme required for sulfatase activity
MPFARLPRVVLAVGVVALLGSLAVSAHAITIDWLPVGDPGNAADTTGSPNPAGAVADSFQIMKFEFTNQQYTEFLNSVAATDTYSLYNAGMGNSNRGGITQMGVSGAYTYEVRTNMGNKPVNLVDWFAAARVSNWLMNGATGTSSTETGAYTLSGSTSGNAPARNPGATFYVPTEDQWYKAAYYKGGSTNAGYWDYATQSNTAPQIAFANSTGIGSSGTTGNFANYNIGAIWNGPPNGNVTTVGTNGRASAYGAFDMSGNVTEWTDTGASAAIRAVRGGNWGSAASFVESSKTYSLPPSSESFALGFRLVRDVPEIDPNGLSAALGLIVGGLGLLERRRYAR